MASLLAAPDLDGFPPEPVYIVELQDFIWRLQHQVMAGHEFENRIIEDAQTDREYFELLRASAQRQKEGVDHN